MSETEIMIKDLKILSDSGNIASDSVIFRDSNIKYAIPLYQRAFAWGDEEIQQLIEDIYDFEADYYYLGSLIVDKKDNENENEYEYEVVDGQQRLTALFLLLNEIGEQTENTLIFKCRDKSNYTLKNIRKKRTLNDLPEKDLEDGIVRGKKIIKDIIEGFIGGNRFDLERFKCKLKKVVLFRICVPKDTDLNRYFEIMNTRGEQLEQHDILKATLMYKISSDENKELFADIWNACSNMNGYVQMHFKEKQRTEIFGGGWDRYPVISFSEEPESSRSPDDNPDIQPPRIKAIIEPTFKIESDAGVNKEGKRIRRFESIITFPFFLLHTLKVLVKDKGIEHVEQGEDILAEMLDDKKLTDTFKKVIDNGQYDGQRIAEKKEQFSRDYICCLLKCRYLFDKYIIKRVYIDDKADGEWSLRQLKKYEKGSDYSNTEFRINYEHDREKRQPLRHKRILMIQSCLRVSYTSQKVMHWITKLLQWLYCEEGWKNLNEYEGRIESIAKKAVEEDYFGKLKSNDPNLSHDTNAPRIMFNYLDYLLWRDKQHLKNSPYSNFVFEFRNSVEHWYPQKPTDNNPKWEKALHHFGNLALVPRTVNSNFSNNMPAAKKENFKDKLGKQSLKLQKMADLTSSNCGWSEKIAIRHGTEMIEKLATALNLNIEFIRAAVMKYLNEVDSDE